MERVNQRINTFEAASIYSANSGTKVDVSVRSNTAISLDDYYDKDLVDPINHGLIEGLKEYKERLIRYHHSFNGWPLPETGYDNFTSAPPHSRISGAGPAVAKSS